MNQDELNRSIASDLWLLEAGIVPETVQQTLIGFGYLASDKVTDVQLTIDVIGKKVTFKLFLAPTDYARWQAAQRYAKPKGLIGKGLKLLTLKLSDDLCMRERLTHMMHDYLPKFKWDLEVERA